MKYVFLVATLGILCVAGVSQEASAETVYAKHSFYAEKLKHETTNYAAGTCYPVNSAFTIEKTTRRNIYIKSVKTGEEIVIKNGKKYTHLDIDGIKDRMFSSRKVKVSGSSKVINAIKNCKVIQGMTKKQVLLARGYPPSHRTSSLLSDRWVYWYKRFSNGAINFKNDRVSSITGLVQPRR